MSRRLKYDRVRCYIEEQIRSNDWPPGHVLPSNTGIAHRLGVSHYTVSLAVRDLILDGVLNRSGRNTATVTTVATVPP